MEGSPMVMSPINWYATMVHILYQSWVQGFMIARKMRGNNTPWLQFADQVRRPVCDHIQHIPQVMLRSDRI